MPEARELRETLAAQRAALRAGYAQSPQPLRLLRAHTALVDRVLREAWKQHNPGKGAAFAATGGYGRGELYPYSDVDLLVLLPAEPSAAEREQLEQLIGLLWDIGLEVGHGVRTRQACLEAASADITVQTALLEMRFLAGNRRLFESVEVDLRELMDPVAFLEAKLLEQEQRHAKHQDTPYALEPNLKESPGGLRDLQVIHWIARAAGVGGSLRDLQSCGLMHADELREFARDERFLKDLRIRLHYVAGRREDRIVFDHQTALAAAMDFGATASRRASEVLMQRYYRTAKFVTQLNVILLQNLRARLVPESGAARPINERFSVRGELLEASDEGVFERDPRAVLESFLLLQQHPELRGMTAMTLRALWRARHRVDAKLRRDPHARLLFVHFLQQRRLVHEFRRMNQYDILGRYLPEFGRIVGQMQHDLFHVYTVDQHILMVVRNLRRFTMPEFAHEFPLCSQLISGFARPWLLYVAALFHDIAKGRGGDHSQFGGRDARRFCRQHGLSAEDGAMVSFLVEQHLSMSSVAQKQDVHDPEVVSEFAARVGTERRLIALYLLTVADVRGTSPRVWNGWKAKLLEDLFRATRRTLTGRNLPLGAALAEKQEEALRLLRLYALSDDSKDRLWSQLDTTYFLRHDAKEIAWQTRNLFYQVDAAAPIVRARLAPYGEGLQVMVYAKDREGLFARICGHFHRASLSILEAKVHTLRNGYALDSFSVLGPEGTHHRDLIRMVEKELADELAREGPLEPPGSGRMSRRVRHFPITPLVDIRPDERGSYQVLSIVAGDRPGLLYAVALVLTRHGINLHSAKINTLGDRAEDIFLVSGSALAQPRQVLQLEQELLAALQVPNASGVPMKPSFA